MIYNPLWFELIFYLYIFIGIIINLIRERYRSSIQYNQVFTNIILNLVIVFLWPIWCLKKAQDYLLTLLCRIIYSHKDS